MICSFESKGGINTASTGAKIVFNTSPIYGGRRWILYDTKYDECVYTTFDICKIPDMNESLYFSNDEYRDLMRWLNRTDGFHKFRIIPLDSDVENCYFNGSFNANKILLNGRIIGLRLTLNTDSPYGYGDERKTTITTTRAQTDMERVIICESDNVGDIYVDMDITCNSSGNLIISNLTNGCDFIIKNCTRGEIINVEANENHRIMSSLRNSGDNTIYNSWNKEFFTISRLLKSGINKMKISLPSTITFKYKPIIKDIPD